MNLLDKKREELRSRTLQRVGSVLVCMSLLLSLAFPPQPAKAVAVADDLAIAAIVAVFLASCGITLHATGMDTNGVTEQIGVMIDQYLTEQFAGQSRLEWFGGAAETLIGFQSGQFILPRSVASKLCDLARWVRDRFVSETDTAVIYSFDSRYLADIDGNRYLLWGWTTDVPHYTKDFRIGSIVFKKGMSPYSISFYGETVYFGYKEINGSERIIISCSSNSGIYDLNMDCLLGLYVTSYGSLYISFTYPPEHTKAAAHPVGTVATEAVSESKSTLAVDASAISIPTTIPDTQELAISTGAASDLTLDQALEQILAAIAAGELSATKEIAEAGTATGEDVVPVDDAFPDVGELGLPALADTLTTRFPFSIPWDVAKAVRLLAAPAKTPRFEVDFFAPIAYRFGGKLGNTKIVLDFSEYEIIGQVSRWTSTIGFCLMLASGTKKLIWTA